MIREEAVAVLKAFMENPLFSDVHRAAFNIAIHDIKAYHKWNLNELVLTQKDNEQEPIPDKLRAEIEPKCDRINSLASVLPYTAHREIQELLCEIIDLCKAESETDNGNDD